jgi:DNA sulfur modification protein DndE
MSWKVFSGDYSDIFSYCIHLRAAKDGLGTTTDGLAATVRNHLHRGLGYLVADRDTNNLSETMQYWLVKRRSSE